MKFSFDFNLSAWITNVEIEADSLEKAKEELLKMTTEELLEEGVIRDSDIKDLDYEILEKKYTIKVTNIVYDEDVDPTGLPTELMFTTTCAEEDLKDEIESYMIFEYEEEPKSYKYKILKEE